jgi:hypothetical protein
MIYLFPEPLRERLLAALLAQSFKLPEASRNTSIVDCIERAKGDSNFRAAAVAAGSVKGVKAIAAFNTLWRSLGDLSEPYQRALVPILESQISEIPRSDRRLATDRIDRSFHEWNLPRITTPEQFKALFKTINRGPESMQSEIVAALETRNSKLAENDQPPAI